MTLMKRHGADELYVKVTHARDALGSLAHGGESLGEHVVRATRRWRNAHGTYRSGRGFLLGHLLKLGLKTVDLVNDLVVALKVLIGSKGQLLT